MKLIGVELGRVVLLFQPEEIRPKHGVHQKTLLQSIRERYDFSLNGEQVASALMKGDQSPGFILRDGIFVHGQENIAISELGIFADGISITASSTMDAEVFLADFFKYTVDEFNYTPFKRAPTKLYNSHVVVSFDDGLPELLQVLNGTAGAIGSSAAKMLQNSRLRPPSLTRIAFGWDTREDALPFGGSEFVIERRANVPHREGFYFSRAPLPTEEHLRTLEAIERSLV